MTKKILIAEDNIALASVIRFNAQSLGFDARTAPNGQVAYEMATRESFDLLISDYQMPEMNGLELVAALRRLEQTRDMRVIMLTAKRLELNLEDLEREYGIKYTFAKPFSPHLLLSAVEEILSAEASR